MTARNEPLVMMSPENQDLEKVRQASRKRGTRGGAAAAAAEGRRLGNDSYEVIKPISSGQGPAVHVNRTAFVPEYYPDLPVKLEKDRRVNGKIEGRYGGLGVSDQFASKSSNFTGPSNLSGSWTSR